MGLAWDGDAELVVVEAQAAGRGARRRVDDPGGRRGGPGRAAGPDHLGRGPGVRGAGPPGGRPPGRPPCPLCGLPLDANGHVCPRQNGYRRGRGPTATGGAGNTTSDWSWTTAVTLDLSEALELLRTGEMSIEGRLVDASNTTLYCALTGDGVTAACVYKPSRASGRCGTSRTARWPARGGRVRRLDGAGLERRAADRGARRPFGEGMVQLWMDGDETVDLARLVRDDCRRCAGWCCSTRSSTTPTARAATSSRCPAATCTAWTTGSRSTSRTSCAQCSGPGPASSCRRRRSTPVGVPGAARGPARRRAVGAAHPARGRRGPAPGGPAADPAALPRAVRGLARDPVAAVLRPDRFRAVRGPVSRLVDMSLLGRRAIAKQLTCPACGDIIADGALPAAVRQPGPDHAGRVCAGAHRRGGAAAPARGVWTTSRTRPTSSGAISRSSSSTAVPAAGTRRSRRCRDWRAGSGRRRAGGSRSPERLVLMSTWRSGPVRSVRSAGSGAVGSGAVGSGVVAPGVVGPGAGRGPVRAGVRWRLAPGDHRRWVMWRA